MTLPGSLLARPIAHRGLHDGNVTCPENSRMAVQRAVEAGFGIEVDLQVSSDGIPFVFHDHALKRMTGENGVFRDWLARDLQNLTLAGTRETVPTLQDILDIIGGRVPLLIEMKDQHGAFGDATGPFEAAVASVVEGYNGPLALMSYNPYSVAAMQTLAPDLPRGLVTDGFMPEVWSIPEPRLKTLRTIPDYERVGASFISHNHHYLDMPRINELKSGGAIILCWTVRSPEDEATARRIADNVTFEGYLPENRS